MTHVKPASRPRIGGRHLLVIILIIGMSVAGYLAYNVWNRIQSLDSAQQDHAEWVFTQIEIEFLKTDRALVRARSGTEDDLDDLRKRFDIFYSRVLLAERVRNNAEAKPRIQELRRQLDAYLPLIDGSDEALLAGLDRLDGLFRTIENVPREVALSSIAIAAEFSQNERRKIVRLIEFMGAAAFIVALALVAAVYRLSRQASRLNRATEIAEENQLRLATTLRASLDAIVVIGDDGRIRDYNGSAEEIFGLPREEAMGRDYVSLIIPPHLRDQQRELLERFRRSGKTLFADRGRQEFEMIDTNGRIFPVEMSVSHSPSADGRLFIAYIRDITDKRQREAEIIAARDEALDAYQEKSRFFAMMSHEMRTPLNGVISALQLLQDERLDEEQKRYLDAAMASGEILLGHINDVLAIERSEASTDRRLMKACDVAALTAGIIGTLEPLASSSGTRLHLDQTGLDDSPIRTDPRAIQQVLVNLLSNAIKFNPEGKVTLRGWYAPDPGAPGNRELWLQVEDDGPGIPAEDIERIFEDFVSLDSRYERRTGGTGLGLGIVRRLVRKLGGEIRCESVFGEGATFTLRLPAEPADSVELASLPAPRPDTGDEPGLRLLVVDDNAINRDLMEAMLRRIGHEVTLANGGQEAIEAAGQAPFDAILMDISMPDVNGIQATEAILSGSGPNRDTPIIAVTAHAMPAERKEFSAVGMSGFLQKPLDMQELRASLEAISAQLEPAPSADPGATRRNAPEVAAPNGKPVLNERQVSDLMDLLGEERLRAQYGALVQQVERDLPGLFTADGSIELQSRAHAMAGMCGMLGAEQMHGLLKDIETGCKRGDETGARQILESVPGVWGATQDAWSTRLGL